MLADKRADISVAMPGQKILCELKRDYHDELWTAAEVQLERFTRTIPRPRVSVFMECFGSAKSGLRECPNTRTSLSCRYRRLSWRRCCGSEFRREGADVLPCWS